MGKPGGAFDEAGQVRGGTECVDVAAAVAHPARDAVGERCRVGHRGEEDSVRPDDATHFGERGVESREVLEAVISDYQVERV